MQNELKKERSKVQAIAVLLSQMRNVVNMVDENGENNAILAKFTEERDLHVKTKEQLADQQKELTDAKTQIENLQKRIKV